VFHIINRVGAYVLTQGVAQITPQFQVVDQLVNDLDFGVDILFEQDIKGDKTDGKREGEGDAHIIPAVFKIVINGRYRYSNSNGVNKYQYA